ncbi:MAG: Xaa-Pro peptidase family protein [Gemmatimonadaceae bacterium]|nr:Xaa-Pro peptidase family protein [Gemmatimonadaceae bacterium]
MTSRRDFLGVSATVAASAALTSARADAMVPARTDDPPAIAALKSMRDKATPITVAERQGRLERARALMRANKLDAMMLTGGTSMDYFTGMRWGLSERLLAVIIPVQGNAFLVTPKFEEERALEQARTGPLGAGTEVMAWEEDESPYELVAKGLRGRGIATGTLGVEETVRWQFSDGAQHALPQMSLVSATSVSAGCRIIKDAHEIALMRLAAQVTLTAYEAAWKSIKEGMTQGEFADLVARAHTKLGFTGGAGVQVGQYAALPHGSVTPQVIREGSILLIDGGCKVEGYSSDISRTFVLGKPTQKMKDVFDIVHRAQTTVLKTARPGIACGDLDAAARTVVVDAGYGPGYRYFSHRVGHGLGMDGHEWPYLVKGNPLPLAPHMTFSDEPGIYIPGEFGVRLEDDLHILDDGAELFTPQSTSLEKPF